MLVTKKIFTDTGSNLQGDPILLKWFDLNASLNENLAPPMLFICFIKITLFYEFNSTLFGIIQTLRNAVFGENLVLPSPL